MAVDLSAMSRKQLLKLMEEIQGQLKTIEAQERQEAREAAEKAAAKFGFTLSDLTGGAGKSRKKSGPKSAGTPKYANPDDASQTWTGKGRQPQWFKAAVDAGKDPATMEL